MQKRHITRRFALVLAGLAAVLSTAAAAASAVVPPRKQPPPVRRADPTDPREYLLPSEKEKTRYATRIADCLARDIMARTRPYVCNYLWPKAMETCMDWSYDWKNRVIEEGDYLRWFTFGPYMECLAQKAAWRQAEGAVSRLMLRLDYAAFNRWGAGRKEFSELDPDCPQDLWPGGTALSWWQARRSCASALPESVVVVEEESPPPPPPSQRRGWRRFLPARPRWWPLGVRSKSAAASSSHRKSVAGTSHRSPSSGLPRGGAENAAQPPSPHREPPRAAQGLRETAWRQYFLKGPSKAAPASDARGFFRPKGMPVSAGR